MCGGAHLAQDVGEEGHEHTVLLREFEAHGADRIDDDNLELRGGRVGERVVRCGSERHGVATSACVREHAEGEHREGARSSSATRHNATHIIQTLARRGWGVRVRAPRRQSRT
jgi:hypothetical protein